MIQDCTFADDGKVEKRTMSGVDVLTRKRSGGIIRVWMLMRYFWGSGIFEYELTWSRGFDR